MGSGRVIALSRDCCVVACLLRYRVTIAALRDHCRVIARLFASGQPSRGSRPSVSSSGPSSSTGVPGLGFGLGCVSPFVLGEAKRCPRDSSLPPARRSSPFGAEPRPEIRGRDTGRRLAGGSSAAATGARRRKTPAGTGSAPPPPRRPRPRRVAARRSEGPRAAGRRRAAAARRRRRGTVPRGRTRWSNAPAATGRPGRRERPGGLGGPAGLAAREEIGKATRTGKPLTGLGLLGAGGAGRRTMSA